MVDRGEASAFASPALALGISRLARNEQQSEQQMLFSEDIEEAAHNKDDDDDDDWVVLDKESIPAAESLAFSWPSSARSLLLRRLALRRKPRYRHTTTSSQAAGFIDPDTGEERKRSYSFDSSANDTPTCSPFSFGYHSRPSQAEPGDTPTRRDSDYDTPRGSSRSSATHSNASDRRKSPGVRRRRSTCSSNSLGPGRHHINSAVSLWKRGWSPFSLWRKRVFQLMSNRTIYYRSPDGVWHKIDVTKITEIRRNGTRIELVTAKRVYYLDSAESDSTAEEIENFTDKVRAIVCRDETKDNFRLAALRVAKDQAFVAEQQYKKEMALLKLDLAELEGVCKICLEDSANALFLECGHLVCCVACARHRFVDDQTCPMCGEVISRIVKTYTAVE